jgi:hypothetical protein
MKLNEIKDITALVESFDSSFPFTVVSRNKKEDVYRIDELETNIFIIFDKFKGLSLAELSFTSDDSQYSLTKSRTAKETLKLFGTLLKVVEAYSGIHIWYFSAKKDNDEEQDYQKRVQFYSRFAKRLAQEYSLVLTSRVLRGDTIFILASAEVPDKDIVGYITS